MINIINLNKSEPYSKFQTEYLNAIKLGQDYVESMLVASYSLQNKEVDARYVNCKYINDTDFIFFSNYESPKSFQFSSHNQIIVVIFWSKLNLQIRMKGLVEKVPQKISDDHFKNRSFEKNALAISSSQSKEIDSFESVMQKYNYTLKNANLKKRPDYWGGYSFRPNYFEFWKGNENRVNHREAYKFINNQWVSSILEP